MAGESCYDLAYGFVLPASVYYSVGSELVCGGVYVFDPRYVAYYICCTLVSFVGTPVITTCVVGFLLWLGGCALFGCLYRLLFCLCCSSSFLFWLLNWRDWFHDDAGGGADSDGAGGDFLLASLFLAIIVIILG